MQEQLDKCDEKRNTGDNLLFYLTSVYPAQLAERGEVYTPSIADLFVAVVGNHAAEAQGAAV